MACAVCITLWLTRTDGRPVAGRTGHPSRPGSDESRKSVVANGPQCPRNPTNTAVSHSCVPRRLRTTHTIFMAITYGYGTQSIQRRKRQGLASRSGHGGRCGYRLHRGDWLGTVGMNESVSPVQPYAALKEYRCPGCLGPIRVGVGHLVVVPEFEADLRRHWHRGCWFKDRRKRGATPLSASESTPRPL